jgi:uncharacterized protein
MALTASPQDQARLLDLQALDLRLRQLQHRASALPELKELQDLATAAVELRGRLSAATGAWEDNQTEIGRLESDVALVEQREQRDRDRLQTTSSVKDVQALEAELASLARRRGDLEDVELGLMEQAEGLRAELDAVQAEHGAQQARVAAAETARDAALAAIAEERQQVTGERERMAAGLPEDLVALYEKQRERYGMGASLLRARVTSASGVALTESDLAQIRRAAPDAVILCPDSQAILVRTDESGL